MGEVCELIPVRAILASLCQPGLRSPDRNGSIVRPCPSGGIAATSDSASTSGGSFKVDASQANIFPPSLSAPPSTPRF